MARWGSTDVSDDVGALLARLMPAQADVARHPVYAGLTSLDAVRVFMEHHVFAVWDFMSLLKALQGHLTSTTLPWRPVGSPATRRFVNELVLEEESDASPTGDGYTSHFELYLSAMDDVGADTLPIRAFLDAVTGGATVDDALVASEAPASAAAFVRTTWRIVSGGDVAAAAGAFAFGRESLIPSMFRSVRDLSVAAPRLALFCAYLDRHIELDGEQHTPLAFRMLDEICGTDAARWGTVADAAETSLAARQRLWDGVVVELSALRDRRPAPA